MKKSSKYLCVFLKHTCFFIFALSIANYNISELKASEITKYIDVGLESKFKDISQIKISNDTLFLNNFKLQSKNGFIIKNYTTKYAVRSKNSFSNLSDANYYAQNLNNNAKLYIIDSQIYVIYNESVNSNKTEKLSKDDIIINLNNTIELYVNDTNNNIVVDNSNLYISTDLDKMLNINGNIYRGKLKFVKTSKGFTVVNNVLLEEYLYSVVPSEMPASWNIEALKAQAVAARSYLLANLNSHMNSGYNVCDTIHSQVYLGYRAENTKSSEAVLKTKGQVAYHAGKPINAVFFSSSGGITENSENVWLNQVPYLKSKKEINEIGHKIWSISFSKEDINNLLKKNNHNIGDIQSISIDSMENDRVFGLKLTGSNANIVLQKEAIRSFFYKKDVGILPSRFFTLETSNVDSKKNSIYVYNDPSNIIFDVSSLKILNADSKNKKISLINKDAKISISEDVDQSSQILSQNFITFEGKGNGHGVGLSQYGAKGMAEIGYTHDQILKHYFTDIEIK